MDNLRSWTGGFGAVLLGLLLGACGDKKSSARHELKDAGYDMTADGWLRAAAADDVEVMKRFVSGGFAADTKNAAGDNAMHAAAAGGAKNAVKYLLGKGFSLNAPGASRRTPLMAAVMGDKPAMVAWLLKQGADPLPKDADGYKALHLAVREGRAGCVEELAPYNRGELDNSILMASLLGKEKVIEVLANYGASVYSRMDDGRTCLMLAAENGHLEAAKTLLDIGANRFTRTSDGRTAADMAKAAGHAEVAALVGKEPGGAELGIDSPESVGEEMSAYVDANSRKANAPKGTAAGAGATEEGTADQVEASSQPRPPGGVRTLDGAQLASRPARATAGGQDSVSADSTAKAADPVIMRQFRQRGLPLVVSHVEGASAEIRMTGDSAKDMKVAAGSTIPGTRLRVLSVHRKMKSTKLNNGEPMEVSVVEVEDAANGRRRELMVGVESTAHDPVALVEDSASGSRYVAAVGQKFRGGDGVEYVVADVRPNQIILENTANHQTRTISLRGPRG